MEGLPVLAFGTSVSMTCGWPVGLRVAWSWPEPPGDGRGQTPLVSEGHPAACSSTPSIPPLASRFAVADRTAPDSPAMQEGLWR